MLKSSIKCICIIITENLIYCIFVVNLVKKNINDEKKSLK